jgi:FeS assembly SUF system regulator
MIRMRKLTDYGIVILAHFARQDPEFQHTARSISEAIQLPQPTVSKLLKLLTRQGFLNSQRGSTGGYSLAVAPEAVTVAAIIEALEGPIGVTECSIDGDEACEARGHCMLSAHWPHINLAVRTALAAVTLWDISRPLSFKIGSQQVTTAPLGQD